MVMKTIGCGVVVLAFMGCVAEPGLEEASVEQTTNGFGKRLFDDETFGGNGRTCSTCHGEQTGTVSPVDAQALFALDPDGPLFRSIDSDDGVGSSYSKLLTDATIRVTLPLPAGWTLADDPAATTVTVRRAIPSTRNVPSLDTLFMSDGRFDTLQAQAHGAIDGHYQPGREPTGAELDAIAGYEQSNEFFSSNQLKQYANGGAAPTLPLGTTAAQIRGRKWFATSATAICSHCHDGPMLNQTNQFLIVPLPPGSRFFTAFVSEFNKAGNPARTFLVAQADGSTATITSPDPGRALITGNPADANFFRIPTLWGAAKTGPWFHDNSAKTLGALTQHYSDYFQAVGLPPLSAQDQTDIIEYLKLLE
jgi:cytochrome c peroxidase